MMKIKTALISVWDKTNIVDFAKFLIKNNIEIISTGGTKRILEENNIEVISVSEITDQKEIMNGRVKTIHPKIFGGILADRNQDNHINDLINVGGRTIDLVVVNLYPFQEEAIDKKLDLAKAIEFIDIGGPSIHGLLLNDRSIKSKMKSFDDWLISINFDITIPKIPGKPFVDFNINASAVNFLLDISYGY